MQPFESSPPLPTIAITDEDFTIDPPDEPASDYDRALVMLTCANCGARMIERK